MTSKLNRNDIGEQLLTTIAGNHLETQVFDGFYVKGKHALEHGAILQDETNDYRLYYSFDGVGLDIVAHEIHIVLTTSNYGSPFHQYMWLFIGQNAVRQIFSLQTVSESDRIILPRKMLKTHDEAIATFSRHIKRLYEEDFDL